MASAQNAQQFGKYSLVERIAVGGMAEVYRAKTYGAAGFEKDLVIKRILEKFSDDDEFVRMFIDEARLAARLQHPNLVQIFDFDRVETQAGPSYYIAMEWVDGKDVRQVLKEMVRQKRPISYAAAVHIAIETLRGLHYAHTKVDGGQPLNIVHRDVSPHNVLVSFSGDVKLSDFGIAKAAARASATSNGMVKGKLAYMSPEQITGQVLDRRSDVFSMGIVLFEMLTRTRLFSGDSEVEVIAKVRDGVVPPPRSRNPEIPEDLEKVLLRMLTRDLSVRYASAADAARALAGTSVYSPTEALSLGDYVASLFPPGQRAAAPAAPAQAPSPVAPAPRAPAVAAPARAVAPVAQAAAVAPAKPAAPAVVAAPAVAVAATMAVPAPVLAPAAPAAVAVPSAPLQPGKKSENMANQSNNPPSGKPPAQNEIAGAATVMLEAPQIPGVTSSPSAPAAAPIAEQKTAILDGNSPQMANVQAQIAEAVRARGGQGAAAPGAPPPAAPPPPAAGGGRPMVDQKTAILDVNSPAHAGALAAARAAASAPAGGGQRTVALDMSAAPQQQAYRPPAQPAQHLAPIAPVKPPSTAIRWVIGPLLSLFTCGVTYAAAGALLPKATVEKSFTPPPPAPVKMGKIKIETSPPGASVTVNGKPHNHFTPTEIEGPIGEATSHVVVKLAGYQTWEQDVLFAERLQPLTIPLVPGEAPKGTRPTGGGGGSKGSSAPSDILPVGDKGMIGIRVDPEADVTVDGQAVGKTPIGALTLKPGVHVFQLSNERINKREKLRIEIFAGENAPIIRNWNRK